MTFERNLIERLAQSEHGRIVTLGPQAQATAVLALSGLQTVLALLADKEDCRLQFGEHTANGLVDAAGACTALARLVVSGGVPDTYDFDTDDGEQILDLAATTFGGGPI